MASKEYLAVRNFICNEMGLDGRKVKDEIEKRANEVITKKMQEVDTWYNKYKEPDFQRSIKYRIDWLNSHIERHASVYIKDAIKELVKEEIKNTLQFEISRMAKEGLFDIKININPKISMSETVK